MRVRGGADEGGCDCGGIDVGIGGGGSGASMLLVGELERDSEWESELPLLPDSRGERWCGGFNSSSEPGGLSTGGAGSRL